VLIRDQAKFTRSWSMGRGGGAGGLGCGLTPTVPSTRGWNELWQRREHC
jgi:hypothetical protein